MADTLVVVTDHDFDDLSIEREILDPVAEVRTLTTGTNGGDAGALSADDKNLLAAADGILNLRMELSEKAINTFEQCRIIARYGIGVDNVAVDAASRQGIHVTNVPDYCIEEVATHAFGMALSLVRSLPQYDRSVSDGQWNRGVGTPVHRFSSQTVGVVGFGAIGRAFGERAAALGAEVISYDPYVDDANIVDYDVTLAEFEDLLDRSDIVSIHSPLTDATRGLFDEEALHQMKEDAYVINASRGPIIDGEALHVALNAGEIGGAGLDVFPDEPPAQDDPLRDHESVLATPHVGWYSEEASTQRRRDAARCVRDVLTGDRPSDLVNEDAFKP